MSVWGRLASVTKAPPTVTSLHVKDLLVHTRALTEVMTQPDLHAILQRVVEVSVQITDARFGGIRIVGNDGWSEQIVRVGGASSPDDQQGHLRVPIHVREEEFASLHLAARDHRRFSAEDERVAQQLANAAGVAIANVQAFEASAFRETWLRALVGLTDRLVGREELTTQDLGAFVRCLGELSEANLAYVVTLSRDRTWFAEIEIPGLKAKAGTARFPVEGTLAGIVIDGGQPVLARNTGAYTDPRLGQRSTCESILMIPIKVNEDFSGVLTLARDRDRRQFSNRELEMSVAFAARMGIALSRMQTPHHWDETIHKDRARIARNLNEQVIQQLFATAIGLQATAASTDDSSVAGRIAAHIGEIDQTISRIRETIFSLTNRSSARSSSLRSRLLRIVDTLDCDTDLRPDITFVGPVDAVTGRKMADEVCAVVTEGISNAARHAEASSVAVVVSAVDEQLAVELVDDGHCPDPAAESSSLQELRELAVSRGGDLVINLNDAGGMKLSWVVPI